MVALLTESVRQARAGARARTECYTLSDTSTNWVQAARISRDPIGEEGMVVMQSDLQNEPLADVNVYEFVHNSTLNNIDRLGLYPLAGFHVVGSVIEEWYGKALQAVGIDHVDISYNNSIVFIGAGGQVGRWGRTFTVDNKDYPLTTRTTGNMLYGRRAKCPCKGASDADILDCLSNRKRIAGRNCQGDTQDAVGDCCLSGFSTLVGSLFPSTSGR